MGLEQQEQARRACQGEFSGWQVILPGTQYSNIAEAASECFWAPWLGRGGCLRSCSQQATEPPAWEEKERAWGHPPALLSCNRGRVLTMPFPTSLYRPRTGQGVCFLVSRSPPEHVQDDDDSNIDQTAERQRPALGAGAVFLPRRWPMAHGPTTGSAFVALHVAQRAPLRACMPAY